MPLEQIMDFEIDAGSIMVRQHPVTTTSASTSASSLQGATVSGVIEVFVDEAGWLREVGYTLDGAPPEHVVRSAPFAWTIVTTEMSEGSHVLSVAPRNPSGRVRNAIDVSFTVDNDGQRDNEDEQGDETDPPANEAPSVRTDGASEALVEEPVALRAIVQDDGLPNGDLSIAWSRVSGPGDVVFESPNTTETKATFSTPGEYEIRVAVSDGELRGTDSLRVVVTEPADEEDPPPAPDIDPDALLWVADMETGDISQWSASVSGKSITCGGPQNSGGGEAHASTVVSRSGSYAAALVIEDVDGDQGTRLFRGRCESADHPEGLYYGVWFFVPEHHETLAGWWNVFQFKSKPFGYDGGSDPMWVIDLLDQGDGSMRLRLRDKISGSSVYHGTAEATFPTGRWVHLEAFFRGGWHGDGEIRIWQDGVELWHFAGIDTIREDGDIRWAVNNYTSSIRPDPAVIYIDDATIATMRLGPQTNVANLR